MNGLRHTPIRQNGQLYLKVAVFVIVLTLLLMTGCSFMDWVVGDGRGDWTLELFNGYGINKVNSYGIGLQYKENPEDTSASVVIPNFFVTAYQLHEPFIYLEGIITQRMFATNEELNDRVLSYYIVDTTDGKVIGPFESYDEFVDCCNSASLEVTQEWTQPNNPNN